MLFYGHLVGGRALCRSFYLIIATITPSTHSVVRQCVWRINIITKSFFDAAKLPTFPHVRNTCRTNPPLLLSVAAASVQRILYQIDTWYSRRLCAAARLQPLRHSTCHTRVFVVMVHTFN